VTRDGINGRGRVRLVVTVPTELKSWLILHAAASRSSVSAIVERALEKAREETMKEETLHAAILAAHEALDPAHQGEQWPDPIAWDGRPLVEQVADLLVPVGARIPDVYGRPQPEWVALAERLRAALAEAERR